MPPIQLPTYDFDFCPGLTTSRGQAVRRVHDAHTGAIVRQPFRYRFNDLAFTRAIGSTLSPRMADALDIALAVYIADRYAPRSLQGSRQWHRDISVRIPVRCLNLTIDRDYPRKLEQFLAHLTDDRWSIDLVQRTAPARQSECEVPLFSKGPLPSFAVLHSGGLDSCIGMLAAAKSAPGSSILAASVLSHNHFGSIQRDVLAELRKSVPVDITWARLIAGLSGIERSRQESTQRTRGFLYLTTGAVAAALAAAGQLQVCENGIGAINLPYSPDQIGTHNTRAMHPVILARFGELFNMIAERPLVVSNAGLWKTKAELVRSLIGSYTDASESGLIKAAQQTISCDRFPWTGLRQVCGACTSCLYRRLSLHAAGLPQGDTNGVRTYEFDPLSSTTDWCNYDQIPIFAMRSQVARMRRSSHSFSALVEVFPQLMRLYQASAHLEMSRSDIEKRVVRLVTSYIAEWETFNEGIIWPRTTDAYPIVDIDPAVAAAVAS